MITREAAIGAGNLHQMMAEPAHLKELFSHVPTGSEVFIKFIVTTDNAPADSMEPIKQRFFHAATGLLTSSQKSGGKKAIQVTATMAHYAEKKYLQIVDVEGNPQNSSLEVAKVTKENQLMAFRIYPLINDKGMEFLRAQGTATTCPEAFKVVEVLHKIFAKGIPLPEDQRCLKCFFNVQLRIPGKNLQYVAVVNGIQGRIVGLTGLSSYNDRLVSSQSQNCAGSSSKEDDENAKTIFESNKKESLGLRPAVLEKGVEIISQKTLQGILFQAKIKQVSSSDLKANNRGRLTQANAEHSLSLLEAPRDSKV